MKKLFTLFLMLTACLSTFAQKDYVTVQTDGQVVYLSGAIPPSVKKTYDSNDFSYNYTLNWRYYVGDVLNILSREGFSVEQQSTAAHNTANGEIVEATYLLSRSNGSMSAIQTVRPDSDEEATEVARYNLQGMPVSKSEKGIQVIVYSNYTTKTVVVE